VSSTHESSQGNHEVEESIEQNWKRNGAPIGGAPKDAVGKLRNI